ncbi:hypothetical protein [Corallococcus sicarius]|uniref:hypothetical protein n=1 Tax=Corallococcus sicarius TaxID=2316726 RepID=UPI0011C3B3FD|nr:hypothetical protein [Corallococcus sicarius]
MEKQVWMHLGLSERAQILLSAGSRHAPVVDVDVARRWFLERGVPVAGVFVDFHVALGGVEYSVPGDRVCLGMWEWDVSGKPVAPNLWRDSQGKFRVTCGSIRAAQVNISMREDGAIFEDGDPAYTSIVRCLEDHAVLEFVEQAFPQWPRLRLVVAAGQPIEKLGELGGAVMTEASDRLVVWWAGGDWFVRDGAMAPVDEGVRSVFVCARDVGTVERVRVLLGEAIVEE